MNQQQLQQILAVAAVVAPMIQSSTSQPAAPPVNQQPMVNQQNTGNLSVFCEGWTVN